jgi:hypothetical protein
MGNLNCDIIEKKKCSDNVDISEILKLMNNSTVLDNSYSNMDQHIALEIHYCNNYTIKSLGKILDFYGICKRKLRKDEMIQFIILFETDENNYVLVEDRKRLWNNFKELKEHKFFTKFMICEL